MGEFVSRERFRVYGVSESPNENGRFQLVPFEKAAFNRAVVENKIEDKIFKVAEALYGYGHGAGLCPIYSGSILTKNSIGFDIQNIVDLVDDADPRHSMFYLVFKGQNTECRWFVAVSQGHDD